MLPYSFKVVARQNTDTLMPDKVIEKQNAVDEFISSCTDDDFYHYSALRTALPFLSPFESYNLVINKENLKNHKVLRKALNIEHKQTAFNILFSPKPKGRGWNGKKIRGFPNRSSSNLGYVETDAWWERRSKEIASGKARTYQGDLLGKRANPALESIYRNILDDMRTASSKTDDCQLVRRAWAIARVKYDRLQKRGDAVTDSWKGVGA